MLRIQFMAPDNIPPLRYFTADAVRDAVVNGLVSSGISANRLLDSSKPDWAAGAVVASKRYFSPTQVQKTSTKIIVSTIAPDIADAMMKLRPSFIHKEQRATGERISLQGWQVREDLDPVVTPEIENISCQFLTPVIIPNSPQKKKETGQRYIGNISEVDLSKYFSDRASKLADRKVDLKVTVDEFYLKSTNGKGETVDIKGGRDHSRAVGFRFPFLLSGKAEDLKFVWYSGLGARTRMGAGIFGLNDI